MNRPALLLVAALASAIVPALAQTPIAPDSAPVQAGSGASVTVSDGPNKGEYDYSEPCILAAFGKRPLGVSVVLHGTDSVLSIDMPVLDDKHAQQIQIVLVIAELRAGKGPSSVTYEIDTRPDSALEPFQKAERANKGISGKATTTLMQKGDSALISFSGQTASGVKLEGSLTCKKVS